jgi:hypothetical protein
MFAAPGLAGGAEALWIGSSLDRVFGGHRLRGLLDNCFFLLPDSG